MEKEETSIASGRSMEEIAAGKKVWHSNRANGKAKSTPSLRQVEKTKAAKARAAGSKKNSRAKVSRGKLPAFVSPQLATLVDAPPPGPEWLHEIKFDGYRAITSLAGGKVVMRTRNGLDWTDKFQSLVPALSELPCDSALLDGEIAVADAEGHTDFGALQNALSNGGGGIGYYLFDLLELDGEDLRKRPLDERKEQACATAQGRRRAAGLFRPSEGLGRGGLFATPAGSSSKASSPSAAMRPIVSGRSQSWLKSKCGMEQEFVIIGWRPSDKPRRPFRSLLLGAARGRRVALCRAGRQRLFGRAARRSCGAVQKARTQGLAGGRRAAGDRAGMRISSSRNWSRRSRFAAGPATTWCGRVRSRDCAPTSLASEIVREQPMPKAQGGETREG